MQLCEVIVQFLHIKLMSVKDLFSMKPTVKIIFN